MPNDNSQKSKFDLNQLPKRGRWDNRVLETVDKVDAKDTLEERLNAAMDELEVDTRALIEAGDKAAMIDSVDTFKANRKFWVEMVLGKAAKQRAR